MEEKLLEFISSKHGKIQQGDQGVLNFILSHDTYCFEPRFNSVTIFYDFTYKEMMIYRKPPNFYKEEKVNKAVEEPNIIHFTTSFLSKRPWVIGSQHRYVGDWMRYKALNPWKDVPLWEDNRPKWKREGLEAYKLMPRRIALYLIGFLQTYGRSIRNRISVIMKCDTA